MLVHSSAVGFLVGRGGSTIKETAALSGAGVRILSKSELPACACLGDEVVRVVGSATAAQAALQMLAGQLKAHLLRYGPGNNASTGGRAAVLDVQQMPYMPLGPQQHLEMAYHHPAMAGAAMYAAPGYGGAMQPPAAVMQAPGGFSGTAVEVRVPRYCVVQGRALVWIWRRNAVSPRFPLGLLAQKVPHLLGWHFATQRANSTTLHPSLAPQRRSPSACWRPPTGQATSLARVGSMCAACVPRQGLG
jgi:hypothetical protein